MATTQPSLTLHAHLSGSITRECLHGIWLDRRNEQPDLLLEDPLATLPSGAADYDINTFFPLFTTYIYTLLTTIPTITHSTSSVLSDFAADGVCYLELRTTPRTSPNFTAEQYITTILSCISAHNSSQDDMRTYLILSVDRKHSASEVGEIIDLAVKFKEKGVVGVDLCGNPARAIDIELFQREFKQAKEAGLGLTLHFAEIKASASADELRSLLDMEPDRLGHVIHVSDEMEEEIAGRKIGVELCLSCNVHAKLTEGGFGSHQFGRWWRRGERGAVVICTDDVGVFLSPLSNEYLLASQHFGLGREELLGMCEAASEAIFGGETETKRIEERVAAFRKEMDVLDKTV
ncbi:MAG: hypothetical protein Q9170_004767 [Blastenia crenularia]